LNSVGPRQQHDVARDGDLARALVDDEVLPPSRRGLELEAREQGEHVGRDLPLALALVLAGDRLLEGLEDLGQFSNVPAFSAKVAPGRTTSATSRSRLSSVSISST
jgi:hypothetical protein